MSRSLLMKKPRGQTPSEPGKGDPDGQSGWRYRERFAGEEEERDQALLSKIPFDEHSRGHGHGGEGRLALGSGIESPGNWGKHSPGFSQMARER